MRLRHTIIVYLIGLMLSCSLQAAKRNDSVLPNFRQIFEKLDANRTLYNATNDSLFCQKSEEDWLALAIRRADRNYQMYDGNQELIDQMVDYFLVPSVLQEDATSGHLKLRADIPSYAFDSLRNAMFDHKSSLDPFMGELLVGNILLPYLETLDPQDPAVAARMAHDYYCWGDCLYSIFCMGDSTALPKAYGMFRKSIKAGHYCPSDTLAQAMSIFSACHLLSRPRLNDIGKLRISEADSCYNQLLDHLSLTGITSTLRNSPAYPYNRSFFYMAQHYPTYRLRSLILKEEELTAQQRAEMEWRLSIMRDVIGDSEIVMRHDTLPVMHSTRLLVRARAGLMSYDAALDSCAVYYNDWKLQDAPESTFTDSFRHFVYVAKDMMLLCSRSEKFANRKSWLAEQVCHQLTQILLKRPHAVLDSQDSNLLMILLFDPNLFPQLTLEERVHQLRESLGVTQLQTLAHNDCVVWLAYLICNAVLEQHPEAFVGTFGIESVDEVMLRSDEITRFIVQGAFIHDLGKLRMADVISNEYRHLTDHEFSLIKLHSEYADEFFSLIPEYKQYHDFALGHHRWFDGSAGYPMWYDNTQSPIRFLVDILTVADCLEAATNRLSRNYRRFKSFEETMVEFRNEAGTRYNPIVVESINASPKTIELLCDRISNGWIVSYKSIYESMLNIQFEK